MNRVEIYPPPSEQCLERREEKAGHRDRPVGLVAAAHPESDKDPAETAAGYLKAAGIAIRPPGAWGKGPPAKPANGVTTDPDPSDDPKPANEVTTDSRAAASACEPYRELIEQGLTRSRNAVSIWQELVDQHGFAGSYESVKRFVRKRVGSQVPEARAVIVTAPGEEAQVDYGTGPLVRDSHTGKYRRTRLFVFTLGFSRKCIRLLSFQSSSRIWGELHETAFRRMGGTPKVIVLDNLREGVLQPDQSQLFLPDAVNYFSRLREKGSRRARGGGNVEHARVFQGLWKALFAFLSPSFPRPSPGVYDSSLAFLACSTR